MKRVGVIPALVTLGNGYCGILSIYKTADGEFYTASWLILLAMVFDIVDGKIARMAGVTSSFGAFLDSLSDAISFGVAPAFLAKEVAQQVSATNLPPKILTLLTAVFALGALMRLARYNVEHSMGEGLDKEKGAVASFDGLPTPGAAGLIASLVFLAMDPHALLDYQRCVVGLPFLCLICGCLMVSRVPYFHFGHRFLRGRREFTYLFGIAVVLLLVTKFPHEMLALAFVAYALTGFWSRFATGEIGTEVESGEES